VKKRRRTVFAAGRLIAAASRLANDERADADELAFAIDQRCPAPGRMGRRREERLVQQIFPAAGEFALPDDIGAGHHGRTTEARDQHWVAFLHVGGLAQRHRLVFERFDRAQQAEARFMVVADDVCRHGPPVVVDDFGGVGLDHQVADRQDEAVTVDKDA
jgi:hypothetical protein